MDSKEEIKQALNHFLGGNIYCHCLTKLLLERLKEFISELDSADLDEISPHLYSYMDDRANGWDRFNLFFHNIHEKWTTEKKALVEENRGLKDEINALKEKQLSDTEEINRLKKEITALNSKVVWNFYVLRKYFRMIIKSDIC